MITHFVIDAQANVLASANSWQLAYWAAEFFRAQGIVCRIAKAIRIRIAAEASSNLKDFRWGCRKRINRMIATTNQNALQ